MHTELHTQHTPSERNLLLQTEENADVPFSEHVQSVWSESDLAELTKLGAKVDFAFKHVSFSIRGRHGKEKRILHPISGKFKPGTMVALMGPSGCGKTTLLDILSGRKTLPYKGQILINGKPKDKYFNRISSYIPQSDICSPVDTVFEAVQFCQKMKTDYSTVDANFVEQHNRTHEIKHRTVQSYVNWERDAVVRLVLKQLGLDEVMDSRIGDAMKRGISGGQRRRVSLAKGLITGPAVAFMDEPTSGLSSTDAFQCMRAVRSIVKMFGMTAVIVIHQPKSSVFSLFDHVVLLTQGQCAYNGPVANIKQHIENILGSKVPEGANIADVLLDVVTPGVFSTYPAQLVAYYESEIAPHVLNEVGGLIADNNDEESYNRSSSSKSVKDVLIATGTQRPDSEFVLPKFLQFKHLLARELVHSIRDVNEFASMLFACVVMGLLVGIVYFNVWNHGSQSVVSFQYQMAFVFMVIITASLNALNTVPSLIEQRLVYLNEREDRLYSTLPYLLARMSVSLLTGLLTNFVLVAISFFLAGFPNQQFLFFFLSVFVCYVATDSLLGVLACLCTSVQQATTVCGATIGLFSLFNGFTANTVSTPFAISWICFLSPFYYAFQAVSVALYSDTRDELTVVYGFDREWGEWGSICVLLAMALVLRVLQYVVLMSAKLER